MPNNAKNSTYKDIKGSRWQWRKRDANARATNNWILLLDWIP
jgi:hypothetical protein